MPSDEKKPHSKLEGFTVWGRARSILHGHSRGRNLIVLGVFFLAIAGAYSLTSQIVIGSSESFVTSAFAVMGIFAIVWGMQAYLAGS